MYAVVNTETGDFLTEKGHKLRWGKSVQKRLWTKIQFVRSSLKHCKIPLDNAEIIEYELVETNRFPVTQRKNVRRN